MAATIYDVAADAGVSIKSVSRVLNGEANVSERLRERVEAAVERLGYRRSLSARSLAGAPSSLVAAFADAQLTIEHWRSGRGNDYLSRLELGALMELRRVDRHLIVELVEFGSPTLERDLEGLLRAVRPEGVLLTPPNCDDARVLDILDAVGVAYARIGPETAPERGVRVAMDDEAAAREMTGRLIALGHRRIGFVGGPAAYAASGRRRAGFEAAMRGARLEAGRVASGDFTFGSGLEAGRVLLATGDLTAIFAGNDDMAFGVYQAAAERGLAVPDDLSVAGFDDAPGAVLASPSLTTVRQPVAEMAEAAVRALIPALGGSGRASERIVVAHRLIERASTAPPP